jgi:hypothetical protein
MGEKLNKNEIKIFFYMVFMLKGTILVFERKSSKIVSTPVI